MGPGLSGHSVMEIMKRGHEQEVKFPKQNTVTFRDLYRAFFLNIFLIMLLFSY